MIELLVHIGYHKTATTWLQTKLFDSAALGFTRTHVKHAVPHPIVIPHDLDFDAAACRQHFEPALVAARNQGLLPVLSHERLSGEIHIGGRDSKTTADRLQSVFPEARILIVIREQKAMIRSIYGQFIKGSGVWPFKYYLEPPVVSKKHFKYANFHLDHFKYHRLIQLYQTLFGTKNVLILPYELFRQDPSAFVLRISTFCDLATTKEQVEQHLPFEKTVNPSLSALGLDVKRHLNRFFGQRTAFNPTPTLPIADHKKRLKRLAFKVDKNLPESWKTRANARLDTQIAQAVVNVYNESNAQTSHLIGMDLGDFGYAL